MKKNFPVTQRENDYPDNIRIISLTDPKGIISHVNHDFIAVSGFSEAELLGQNHNIVRHPDMPPVAFADMWNTLAQGEAWMGMVKNRCKNGDHYWVNAYVSPVMEDDQVVAYQSVRTKPEREWVARAERLYAGINNGKTQLAPALDTSQRYLVSGLLVMIAVVVLALLSGVEPLPFVSGAVLLGGVAGWWFHRLGRPLRRLSRRAEAIYANTIAPHVYGDAADDVGRIKCAMLALQARITTLTTRLGDTTAELTQACSSTTQVARTTREGLDNQRAEMHQANGAIKEMVATIADVADNAQQTADAAQHADELASCGRQRMTEMVGATQILCSHMEEAAGTVHKLHDSSENIAGLLEVIQNIAEQTNLLALNAAIEAARAGEEGRGFSVVADEVRSLATRTQESATEIESMIARLRSDAGAAVSMIDSDREESQKIAAQAGATAEEINSIESSIGNIAEMATQIASATEEQSNAATEISRTIDAVHELTEQCGVAAESAYDTADGLRRMALNMKNTVAQFG